MWMATWVAISESWMRSHAVANKGMFEIAKLLQLKAN
jgi:hypothetical protein